MVFLQVLAMKSFHRSVFYLNEDCKSKDVMRTIWVIIFLVSESWVKLRTKKDSKRRAEASFAHARKFPQSGNFLAKRKYFQKYENIFLRWSTLAKSPEPLFTRLMALAHRKDSFFGTELDSIPTNLKPKRNYLFGNFQSLLCIIFLISNSQKVYNFLKST